VILRLQPTLQNWSNTGAGRPTAGPTVPAGFRISTVRRCVCVCEADEEVCNVIQEVVGIDDDEDDGDPST